MGALQFLAEGDDPGAPGAVAGKPVEEAEIARIVADLDASPLGLSPGDDFRISLAGAQEKTALLWWQDRWHKPLGATATTHIFKPAIGRLPNGIDLTDSVENEHLCLAVIAALGLPAGRTEMRTFGGTRVLIVERFDRHWTRDGRLLRVPQEDCCQALSVPPSRKYEPEGGPGIRDVLGLLAGADDPDADRSLFLKAMVTFWLLAATDGHAKNVSLFLRPGGRFGIAPLYDVLSAQPSLDAGQITRRQARLAMAVGDSRHYRVDEIVPRHFVQTAAGAGLGRPVSEGVLHELATTADAGLAAALERLPAGFPEPLAESVARGFRTRLRLIGG